MVTPSGFKDIVIRKLESVTSVQFFCRHQLISDFET